MLPEKWCTVHLSLASNLLDHLQHGAFDEGGDHMLRRTQLWCIWPAPFGVALLALGFFPIARYFPVPAPGWSATQIATFYQDHTFGIRLGLLLGFIALATWAPLNAVLARQMLRVGGRHNPLALIQILCGSVTWVFLAAPLLVFEVAAFRPYRDPQITQALHDLGWFLFIMPFMPFVVQNIALGVCILQDGGDKPVFDRWVGYFNFWIAFFFLPGGMLTFFKHGPFGYDGLFAFWIPVGIFCVWYVVMAWALRRAVLNEPTGDPVS